MLHSCSLVFIRAHSCSLCVHSCSLVFTRVHSCFTCVHSCSFMFHSFSIVFTRVHSCSTCVHSCSICVHLCSFVFHSCSLVFIRVHSCSFVFHSCSTCVHSCSHLCGVLDMIVLDCKKDLNHYCRLAIEERCDQIKCSNPSVNTITTGKRNNSIKFQTVIQDITTAIFSHQFCDTGKITIQGNFVDEWKINELPILESIVNKLGPLTAGDLCNDNSVKSVKVI